MTLPTINPATSKFSWVAATTNTDGSPIVPGEVTGYSIGIRSANAANSTKGVYPAVSAPTTGTGVTDAFSALNLVLKPDTYFAAVQSIGPLASGWSDEFEFVIAQPVPNAPTGFIAG